MPIIRVINVYILVLVWIYSLVVLLFFLAQVHGARVILVVLYQLLHSAAEVHVHHQLLFAIL